MSDRITRTLRHAFQARFGDAGPGFVLPGRPWEWYRRDGVRLGATGGWRLFNANNGGPRDRFFGYGGVAASTRRPRQRVWFRTDETAHGPARVSSVDIHYLSQSRGGDLEVIVDDEHLLTISTEGEQAHSAFHRVDIPDGTHEIVLRTGGGPVRVFGAALERRTSGVVYDSLGVNGACATVLERIDADHLAEQFRHRRPDLIVFAFGANESNRPGLVNRYDDVVRPVFAQVRRSAPEASCLIVSSLDRGARGGSSSGSHPAVQRIVDAQRRAAAAVGCAFFDTHGAMGGAGSMRQWSRLGLASMDLVHPTPEGSELVGRGLAQSLLRAYDVWRDRSSRRSN